MFESNGIFAPKVQHLIAKFRDRVDFRLRFNRKVYKILLLCLQCVIWLFSEPTWFDIIYHLLQLLQNQKCVVIWKTFKTNCLKFEISHWFQSSKLYAILRSVPRLSSGCSLLTRCTWPTQMWFPWDIWVSFQAIKSKPKRMLRGNCCLELHGVVFLPSAPF